MAEIKWTPQAAEDLESITKFIAENSQHYARLFAIDVIEAAGRLAEFPESGRIVPEIKDSVLREIIMGNYRIVYRVKAKLVEILTVYHGARLFDPSKLH